MLPKIYTVVRGPIRGQLGDASIMPERVRCDECGQRSRQEFDFVELVLDNYEGEPLIYVAERFAVTAKLKAALERAKFKGISFREMSVVPSEEYLADEPEVELPEFFEMLPAKGPRAGPGWWEPVGDCPELDTHIWENTEFTILAIVSAHEDDTLPKRTVLTNSYSGEDFFLTDDPGPPIMTERLVDLLKDAGVAELELQPAELI